MSNIIAGVHVEEIGMRLRERRLYLGMTQQDVADILHVNRVTYHQWEKGRNEMAVTDLPRLARALRTSTSYLLGEIATEQAEEDEFLQHYNGLPSFKKEQARRVLSALFAEQDEEAMRNAREETTHGKKAE